MVKNLYSFIVLFNLDLSGNLEKKFQSVYFVSCWGVGVVLVDVVASFAGVGRTGILDPSSRSVSS